MTQPQERTKALVDARELLEILYASEEAIMWDLIRTLAMIILRHYPRDDDIVESAAALPSLWSVPPPARQAFLPGCHRDRTHAMSMDELNSRKLRSCERSS